MARCRNFNINQSQEWSQHFCDEIKEKVFDSRIKELTENVYFLISERNQYYDRQSLKKIIHEIKAGVSSKIEERKIFEWDQVIKKFTLLHDLQDLFCPVVKQQSFDHNHGVDNQRVSLHAKPQVQDRERFLSSRGEFPKDQKWNR